MVSDEERQADEVFALQNIYGRDQFRSNKKESRECFFPINCVLLREKLLIKYEATDNSEMSIKYLPQIRLYVKLPSDYPSKNAPIYNLVISWLPPWQISLVCQKLDDLWLENKNCEILFIWTHFLKNEMLDYLDIKDTLDISYLYKLYSDPENKFLLDVLAWSDNRIIYGGLFLNPLEKLAEHDKFEKLIEFNNEIHECEICFISCLGKLCVRVSQCNHIFCKNCIIEYLTMKIHERNVQVIKCPGFDCKDIVNLEQIKEICPVELTEKHEKYLAEMKLINNNCLVYCPRKQCSKPVKISPGENLASCLCGYNFCPYCFKVYHGVNPCDMNLTEKNYLINQYIAADNSKKKNLEKKYGKHQIKQIVENKLTTDYLKENTKICPTCGVLTTKVSGCNLMTCSKCFTNFCWLCNGKIISNDPYDHFKSDGKNLCQGLLFEGVDEDDDMEDLLDLNLDIDDLLLINELMDEN